MVTIEHPIYQITLYFKQSEIFSFSKYLNGYEFNMKKKSCFVILKIKSFFMTGSIVIMSYAYIIELIAEKRDNWIDWVRLSE